MGLFGKDDDDKKDAAAPKADSNLQFTNSLAQKVMATGIKLDGFRVTFANGVATLTGRAANNQDREKVAQALSGVQGVTRVDNQLQVGTGPTHSVPGATGTGGGKSYTVVSGDTLSEIAQKHYGAASKWKDIYEANKGTIADPDKIKVGQTINLP